MVKNPPANKGGPGDAGFISSLGPKYPLEKEMPTHPSILLENSTDRGDWQATVHGVTKSRKQLSTHTGHLYNTEFFCPTVKQFSPF